MKNLLSQFVRWMTLVCFALGNILPAYATVRADYFSPARVNVLPSANPRERLADYIRALRGLPGNAEARRQGEMIAAAQ